MSIELKVKSKHLSEEARIIRFEERKQLKSAAWHRKQHLATGANEIPYELEWNWNKMYRSLNDHRRWDVRNENRATFLARAFIAGVPYQTIEQKRKPENEYRFNAYIIPRIVSMVAKYGTLEQRSLASTDGLRKAIQEWSKI